MSCKTYTNKCACFLFLAWFCEGSSAMNLALSEDMGLPCPTEGQRQGHSEGCTQHSQCRMPRKSRGFFSHPLVAHPSGRKVQMLARCVFKWSANLPHERQAWSLRLHHRQCPCYLKTLSAPQASFSSALTSPVTSGTPPCVRSAP